MKTVMSEQLCTEIEAVETELAKSIRYREQAYSIPDAVGAIHGAFGVCAFMCQVAFF